MSVCQLLTRAICSRAMPFAPGHNSSPSTNQSAATAAMSPMCFLRKGPSSLTRSRSYAYKVSESSDLLSSCGDRPSCDPPRSRPSCTAARGACGMGKSRSAPRARGAHIERLDAGAVNSENVIALRPSAESNSQANLWKRMLDPCKARRKCHVRRWPPQRPLVCCPRRRHLWSTAPVVVSASPSCAAVAAAAPLPPLPAPPAHAPPPVLAALRPSLRARLPLLATDYGIQSVIR